MPEKEDKITPATWTLLVGILFASAAAVLWIMIDGVVGVRENFVTLNVPAKVDLAFDATAYTVFLEFPRSVDSMSEHKPRALAGLRCRLSDADSGAEIALRPVAGPQRYGYRKTIGESLYDFNIDVAGSYTFEATHPLAELPDPIVLAIRQSYARQTARALLRALAVIAATGLVAALILRRALRPGPA